MAAEAGSEIPAFMEVIVGCHPPAPPRALAERNLLALDTAMQSIYAEALARYRATLRATHPILLALFDQGGGTLMVYPPGAPPVTAPSPPLAYQLVKSAAHSAMASFQLTAPNLREPQPAAWRGPLAAYRDLIAAALPGLGELELESADRDAMAAILEHNLAFLDRALASGELRYDRLDEFARGQTPLIRRAIAVAARAQVHHWTGLLEHWRRELGTGWNRTYAATNTLYMTRTRNTLFELLGQAMGEGAIDERLFLFETLAYTTEPEAMLDMLTRVVADRALGQMFFGDYYRMDVELVAEAVEDAIRAEANAAGRKPLLPGLAPFHTHAWPWTTSSGGDPDGDAARDGSADG
ncbi:MAG: hypothetical protein AB7I59_15880 [Geminicoccaceae bacterium]